MPSNQLRDIVNLLLYGGAFIGLCASSITALTFELIDNASDHFPYIILIGVATAALYSLHRVIGLRKLRHVTTYERYRVIRKYEQHIWLYFIVWSGLTLWFLKPLLSIEFLLWLLPGGSIAISYVLPFLSGGRRTRDLGWVKILLIGWSWSWLTAFLPAYYFGEVQFNIVIVIFLERMLFIIAITIPFEIRDLVIDQSVGLKTLPSRFGLKKSIALGKWLSVIVILLSFYLGFHFFVMNYGYAMLLVCLLNIWILAKSIDVKDDYFFSGLTDGLMILAIILFHLFTSYF